MFLSFLTPQKRDGGGVEKQKPQKKKGIKKAKIDEWISSHCCLLFLGGSAKLRKM